MRNQRPPGRPGRPRPPFDENRRPPNHINQFLNLNGIPYLVGEYLDRNQMRQMNRGHIGSTNVHIDSTSEAMRAIVDIHFNDIPHRPWGNRTAFRNLITATQRNARRLNHQFDVMRRGIIAVVHYRLENARTGQSIRSMSEELRIHDRNFFTDINEQDINDNPILVNFTQSIASTINQFTHGTDRMHLRVMSVEFFYPMLHREPIRRTGSSSHIGPARFNDMMPHLESGEIQHHRQFRSQHIAGTCDCDDFAGASGMFINPPNWAMFNRFYRFDNWGKDVILHFSEIHDPQNRIRRVPCGRVIVNRVFAINPGHRIIFRFSIWKNDVVIVNNTQQLARAIGTQHIGQPSRPPFRPPHRPPGRPPMGIDAILNMLFETKMVDRKQTKEIARLRRMIEELMGNGNGNGPPCCDCYPDCDCCDNGDPPCCDCYPDCDCCDNGDPCCPDYPNCDCCDNGGPCCPDYPDCGCGAPPPPPPCCDCYPNCTCCQCPPEPGDCSCSPMTPSQIRHALEYAWGPDWGNQS